MTKQYAERDAFELDQVGGHYMRHVMAMTAEQLHSKSDIAAELAWRDSQIAELQRKLDAIIGGFEEAIRHKDRLAAELNAMAAENAVLMKFCKNAAFDADYESELGMERGGFTDAINDIKTPATDTYLNSVRAEGVDMLGDFAGKQYQLHEGDKAQQKKWKSVVFLCCQYAVRLRSGTNDTADKAG